ncbi:RICIN domain-containing protein [Massilia sp. TWP1-3-3]|uniref:RICIN domain-containing protein n=1 Tax=Massilia sp. TWP1-3-3 TaxID=2804573 RepID=UPI003CE9725E
MTTSSALSAGRPFAAIAAWLAVSLTLLASPAQAANCSAPVVNGGLYSIANMGSGKVLDVTGGALQGGAYIQQWGYGGSANQQFTLRDLGNGYWSMTARNSGMLLDVLELSMIEGGRLVQWPANGGTNQQWQLKRSLAGGYNVVARHSGKSLTVADGASGSRVYQTSDLAKAQQRWFFNPASGLCNATPEGFASQAGPDGLSSTTGGGSVPPVTVNSCSALVGALQSSAPAVVHIAAGTVIDCRTPARSQGACAISCPSYQDAGKSIYRIPVGAQTCTELGATSETKVARSRNEINIQVASNKTLLGLDSNATIVGATLNLSNAKNVIIRNLSIQDVNPGLVEAGDAITLANSSHVWIDHVRFSLISDGHVDITESKNVTLSWNRFDGANPAVCGNQHFYTNMVLNSQVTFHHNFWNRSAGRNPKLDGGATRAHLYNNYWLDIPYFAINAANWAQGKVEGNFFANASRPHWNAGLGALDAPLWSNRYTGISATDIRRDTGDTVFSGLSMYPYTVDNVDDIPAKVSAGAGPR